MDQVEEITYQEAVEFKRELEELLKSRGWAQLVNIIDRKIAINSAQFMRPPSSVDDLIARQHYGSMSAGYAEIIDLPEQLVNSLQVTIDKGPSKIVEDVEDGFDDN